MSDRALAYWRLLDEVEDFFRYGERTEHDVPGAVRLAGAADLRPRGGPAGGDGRLEQASGANQADAARATQTGEARAVPSEESGAAPGTDDERLRATGADWDSSADPEAIRRRRLVMLEERVRACTRCPLHEGRMNAVPGAGVLDPLVMVIGEGPGADEDRRGMPFVGRAGQYLDKWLEAVDLDRRTNAYITNIVKCRPPENRDPKPTESDACLPYLRDQIELIRPRMILSVGRIASGILIGTNAGIGSLRGRTFYYNGIPLIPTYHPSGVLRNPEYKRPVWEDLKRLRALLDQGTDAD